jgi:hypothetical protein
VSYVTTHSTEALDNNCFNKGHRNCFQRGLAILSISSSLTQNLAVTHHMSLFLLFLLCPYPFMILINRYLLVSTDTARLLILRTCDWSVLRSLFATSEQFHNPVATWHRDSFYLYVATTTAEVISDFPLRGGLGRDPVTVFINAGV